MADAERIEQFLRKAAPWAASEDAHTYPYQTVEFLQQALVLLGGYYVDKRNQQRATRPPLSEGPPHDMVAHDPTRVIFLDIDGVLNTARSRGATRREGIIPECVARLDYLLDITGADVVVTSEWRKFTNSNEVISILGTRHARRFIGDVNSVDPDRHTQILYWLWHHPTVIHFGIIDDRSTGEPRFRPAEVLTNPQRGLSDADVEKAYALLMGEPDAPRGV